jgi:hypothetical protein
MWGDDVIVSTSGNGERYGECSLPFAEFASRLYIFHFDPLEPGHSSHVPQEQIDACIARVTTTWGADRLPEAVETAVTPDG